MNAGHPFAESNILGALFLAFPAYDAVVGHCFFRKLTVEFLKHFVKISVRVPSNELGFNHLFQIVFSLSIEAIYPRIEAITGNRRYDEYYQAANCEHTVG